MTAPAGRKTGIGNWFVNPRDRRLRAGWRILLFVCLFLALAVGGQLGLRAVLGSFPKGSPLIFPVLAVAATLATLIARRLLDRKSFASLGLARPRQAARDLCFGFLLSGAMALGVFLLLAGFGYVTNVRVELPVTAIAGALILPLAVTVLVGYWEELVFRGYLLQNMADGMGLRTAVVISCILYGLVHAGNPNATLVSTLIIVLFGVLRIYGYLATGLLWLSMGAHIGWNFFQGPVFGFNASGHAEETSLLTHELAGPRWLSGGEFGPEGSLLVVPVVLLALLAIRAWSRRYG